MDHKEKLNNAHWKILKSSESFILRCGLPTVWCQGQNQFGKVSILVPDLPGILPQPLITLSLANSNVFSIMGCLFSQFQFIHKKQLSIPCKVYARIYCAYFSQIVEITHSRRLSFHIKPLIITSTCHVPLISTDKKKKKMGPADKVDYYSRFLFPLMFAVFNLILWSCYLLPDEERSPRM